MCFMGNNVGRNYHIRREPHYRESAAEISLPDNKI